MSHQIEPQKLHSTSHQSLRSSTPLTPHTPLPTLYLKDPELQANEDSIRHLMGEVEVLRRAKSEHVDELEKVRVRCEDLSTRLSRLEEKHENLQSRYNTLDDKMTTMSRTTQPPHLEQMIVSPYHFPPFYPSHYPTPTQQHLQPLLPYSSTPSLSTQQQPSQQPYSNLNVTPLQAPQAPQPSPQLPQLPQPPQPPQVTYHSNYPQQLLPPTENLQTGQLQSLLASIQAAFNQHSQQKP
jgi:FtsZ-binding cell division protein ZapB